MIRAAGTKQSSQIKQLLNHKTYQKKKTAPKARETKKDPFVSTYLNQNKRIEKTKNQKDDPVYFFH